VALWVVLGTNDLAGFYHARIVKATIFECIQMILIFAAFAQGCPHKLPCNRRFSHQ